MGGGNRNACGEVAHLPRVYWKAEGLRSTSCKITQHSAVALGVKRHLHPKNVWTSDWRTSVLSMWPDCTPVRFSQDREVSFICYILHVTHITMSISRALPQDPCDVSLTYFFTVMCANLFKRLNKVLTPSTHSYSLELLEKQMRWPNVINILHV